MQSSTNLQKNNFRINLTDLCRGNDYAALTDGYNRNRIQELVWSMEDSDRTYVLRAISIQRKLDNCPEEDYEQFERLFHDQLELQTEYSDAKKRETPKIVEPQEFPLKAKGWNTLEWSVFFYYVCDKLGIFLKNDDCKNCNQQIAIEAISKATGYSPASFVDRLNIDPADSATRKAMKKVATDIKQFMPIVENEIKRDYEEYEEEFSQREREKKNKKIAG